MLEKLYRDDRKAFKAAFEMMYTGIESFDAAKFWKACLDYDIRPDV